MFKRSLLSLMLVASLVSPVAQAQTWTDLIHGYCIRPSFGATAKLSAAKSFAGATISPSTYAGVVKAARKAYSENGCTAAGKKLFENKSAVAGVVLTVAALVAGYFGYNKWLANTTTSTTE